jgi:HK97 family phage prohead protease
MASVFFYAIDKRGNMIIKADGYIEKATKLAEGEVEFVVSTGDIDSHGERISVKGIDYKTYMKTNNVILWGHDGFNLPIGNAVKMWVDGDKLMARAKFYLKDDFPRKVYQYIMDGVLKAVSIGGMVEEWGSDGMTISKLKMKEFSVVSVPANDYALVANKAFGEDKQAEISAMANMYARKVLLKNTGETELQDKIQVLDSLVATLKEVALGEPQETTASESKRHVVLRQAQAVDQQVEAVIRTIKLKGNDNV